MRERERERGEGGEREGGGERGGGGEREAGRGNGTHCSECIYTVYSS